MFRNRKTDSYITSKEKFLNVYECTWYRDNWDERVSTAFLALCLAEERSEKTFLQERAALQSFDWDRSASGAPSFWHIEDEDELDWYSLVDLHLTTRVRAWVYEMEESGWSVIKPGSCSRERLDQTKSQWQREVERIQASGQSAKRSAFMLMMDHRIRKTLLTGTTKHLLINELIQSDAYTRVIYAEQIAQREKREIDFAVREGSKVLGAAADSKSVMRL